MPFASYQSIADVARAHQITWNMSEFVVPMPGPLSDYFRAEVQFGLRKTSWDHSEFALCENLIYPVVKEIWKSYLDDFVLWSHPTLFFDADLSGAPDYLLARKSPLGEIVRDRPYLAVVEAKKDNFDQGWGQCLAALLATQKINGAPDQALFGITSNGTMWEFGKLEGDRFTQNSREFVVSSLDELCGAVRFVFEQCRQQLAAAPCPA